MNYELEFKKAIALLYETFAIYPLNPYIAGCPCCVTQSDRELLRAKLLDKLTSDDLEHFAFNAITTWGTTEDFKHFLPRLLELLAFDKRFYWSSEVIGKLAYAEFCHWKENEQKAINEYFVALWNYILSQYPSPSIYVDELLERLMDITDDLDSFLLLWQNHCSINSLLHLADFIQKEIRFNESPIEIIHFSERNTAKFLSWLAQESIIKKLEKSFFDNLEKPYANRLAVSIDILTCAI